MCQKTNHIEYNLYKQDSKMFEKKGYKTENKNLKG